MAKRFFANHSKSSALIVSLVIHAIIIVIAISYVAVTVIKKKDTGFDASKRIVRPKAVLKSLKVPIKMKKKPPVKPKLRRNIVAQPKNKFVEIKMVEMTGVRGGIGAAGASELGSLGFKEVKLTDLFGEDKSMGNELEGTFYDLKQRSDGKEIEMDIPLFFSELARFAQSWKQSRLDEFFRAPKEKYASFFMIPQIKSEAVTVAFGVEDEVTPTFWAAYYDGYISTKKTGYYRFQGYGDDVLLVRIKRRLVIDASFEGYRSQLKTNWASDSDNNRKYPVGDQFLYIGDWFKLTEGEPVRMEVLIGDVGHISSFQLFIEEKGQKYPMVAYSYKKNGEEVSGTRPVLPAFKTKEIPKDLELRKKMKLDSKHGTLTGPSFGVIK